MSWWGWMLVLIEANLSLGAVKDYSSAHHVTLIPLCLLRPCSANQDQGWAEDVCVYVAHICVSLLAGWHVCLKRIFTNRWIKLDKREMPWGLCVHLTICVSLCFYGGVGGWGDSVNQQRQPPWHVSHIQTTSFILRNPKVPLLLPLSHKQTSTPTQPLLSAGSAGG